MTRRVCIVTGSRADYGLLRWVMEHVRAAPDLELQTVATGMHLAPEFGLTCKEIEKDGFRIDRKIETLLGSDTAVGLTKSMGLGFIGFADALQQLRPDLLLLLGDRFEILPAAAAALIAKTPIAHAHGGEATEGAFDEAIRHSVTKMSHLHFVATERYRKRVIQLGEQPDSVFVVGGLGIDNIVKLPLLSRAELESELGVSFLAKNLLVTFHPATLAADSPAKQFDELLAALNTLDDTLLIFTMPNADAQSRPLFDAIEGFVATHPRARVFTSLGQLRYLSCIQYVDGVVGNSSSGIIEVPTFRKGTVNIGDRQDGRTKATSVIDCEAERDAIRAALDRLYSPEFRATLAATQNPYGAGGAAEKIVEVLRTHPMAATLKKPFYDVEFNV